VSSDQTVLDTFAADAVRDLRREPKQLQARYLYDALGSSLFDAICRLPWYRITRAEATLLRRHAREIAAALPALEAGAAVVELGCGNGEKLSALLEGIPPAAAIDVHLIDISPAALQATSARISRFRNVRTTTHAATYQDGLRAVHPFVQHRPGTMALFLGSNIGNFDPPAAQALLRAVRAPLAAGALLLLGADLVKPEADLLLAYDDPLGVTAAFNKNLLVRVNRELDADFDVTEFDHRAVWNGPEQRVEMHLVSVIAQDVTIPLADSTVHFAAGEHIWTESSYKYTPDQIRDMGAAVQLATRDQWIDEDARFALTMFVAT